MSDIEGSTTPAVPTLGLASARQFAERLRVVIEGGHDTESHARSFNQGYSLGAWHQAATDAELEDTQVEVPDFPTFVYRHHREDITAIIILPPGYEPASAEDFFWVSSSDGDVYHLSIVREEP